MHPVQYEESAVARLLERVTDADGHPPFSEHKRKSIDGERSRNGAWADKTDMSVVGVAVLHEGSGHWAVEIAVAPEQRGSRMEEAAIRVGTSLAPDTAVHTVWAFRADQIDAAERLGYGQIRAVIRMVGPIPEDDDGARPRVTFDAMVPGDVDGIVAVNNRAFLGHPEQGGMTEEDFGLLVERAWFDLAGVVVAKIGGQVGGFCITKYEADGVGEIFTIAVDPMYQQSGIGRVLIGSGFEVLRRRGARRVSLWVDASNETAVRFYSSLGLIEDFRTRELALPS
ncbi:MAG: GNAT family N-acetyltransferase [Actinomycetota bacterium]|nr:GNAT family N-acetyltransferase [Actinomycetota bacterium]